MQQNHAIALTPCSLDWCPICVPDWCGPCFAVATAQSGELLCGASPTPLSRVPSCLDHTVVGTRVTVNTAECPTTVSRVLLTAPSGGIDYACTISGVSGSSSVGQTAVCQAAVTAPGCFGARVLGGVGMDVECGTCPPRCCGINQRVAGRECATCPVGSTNAAGDDANGLNTTCDPTVCPANTYVSSHVCTACPVGKTRPMPTPVSRREDSGNVDNLATVGDTICWPVRCDVLQDDTHPGNSSRFSCVDNSDCCWGICNTGLVSPVC